MLGPSCGGLVARLDAETPLVILDICGIFVHNNLYKYGWMAASTTSSHRPRAHVDSQGSFAITSHIDQMGMALTLH